MSNSLVYRRAVSLINAADRCEGEMEDDFHHFRIRLRHDGERIVEMGGEALRFPWTSCGSGAVGQLSSLKGLSMKPLREQLSREQRYRQCTHLYDLVELAIGQVLRKEEQRLYQVSATMAEDGSGARSAQLLCNRNLLLDWELDRAVITSPGLFEGQKIGQLSEWARVNLEQGLVDQDTVEAVLVMQRSIHVSFGKTYNWTHAATADQMGLRPTCYTLGKDVAGQARRVEDHSRDYSNRPEALLGGRIPGIEREVKKSG